jgi:hypothetical protein
MSKKLHYFPFYYLDWLSSSNVMMMTYEEKGLFMDMLCRCYNDDGLPDDNAKLQRLFKCDDALLDSVKNMFYSVDGLLRNEKLDSVCDDQSQMIKGKSKAGKASAKARAAKKLEAATAVEHVLNPVATEAQRNSTNKAKQSKAKQISKRFIEPTLKDVADYCLERNRDVNPDDWMNHYAAKGWMIGSSKMKDWKAAVRTWEKNQPKKPDIKNHNVYS